MRRTALRSVSKRRRRLLGVRARVVAAVHERDQGCQGAARLPHNEGGGPMDCHELKRRSHDSDGWLIADRCVSLCRNHHRHVTEHPEQGHAVGLVKWSWEVFE
jgi:hypothetical protein